MGRGDPLPILNMDLKEVRVRRLRYLIPLVLLFVPSLTLGADTFFFDSLQESSLFLNAENLQNTIEESNTNHSSSVTDSYKNDTGLFNLNQASGSLNNQSNRAIITYTPGISLSDYQLEYRGESTNNTIKYSGLSFRQSLIDNSFDNSKGVFLVNQSPGNLNVQSNLFILSMGSALVLNDAELATRTGGNVIEYGPDTNLDRRDILSNSFSGAVGVGVISQSSGDLNTITNTLAISFSREIR
jgi:hypothetical protein